MCPTDCASTISGLCADIHIADCREEDSVRRVGNFSITESISERGALASNICPKGNIPRRDVLKRHSII